MLLRSSKRTFSAGSSTSVATSQVGNRNVNHLHSSLQKSRAFASLPSNVQYTTVNRVNFHNVFKTSAVNTTSTSALLARRLFAADAAKPSETSSTNPTTPPATSTTTTTTTTSPTPTPSTDSQFKVVSTPAVPTTSEGKGKEKEQEQKKADEKTPTEKTPEDLKKETKEIKSKLRASPKYMRLYATLGLAALIAAIIYYLNDADNYDQKLQKIVKMISSEDKDLQKVGLDALDGVLVLKKNLFTGPADIPVPKIKLVDAGVVKALLAAVIETSADDNTKARAISWLIRFAEGDDFQPEGDEEGHVARGEILKKGLPAMLNILKTADRDSALWLTAASLIHTLTRTKDSMSVLATSTEAVDTLNQVTTQLLAAPTGDTSKAHPVASLLTAHIIKGFVDHDKSFAPKFSIPEKVLSSLTSPPSLHATAAAMGSVSPHIASPLDEGMTAYFMNSLFGTNFMLAILASAYGSTRWTSRAKAMGLDADKARNFAKKINKTGRTVFFLTAIDLATQLWMMWPEKGADIFIGAEPVQLPNEVAGYSKQTVAPIVGAAALTAGTLLAIRRQRFVVLPMLLAPTVAYYNQIDKATKPLQEQTGFHLPHYETLAMMFDLEKQIKAYEELKKVIKEDEQRAANAIKTAVHPTKKDE